MAILMCTYQGTPFLTEQLDSIAAQTHKNWRLWVSDDGSTDETLATLARYQSQWGTYRMSIMSGPASGSTANFLALTCHRGIEADCFAWADQDDIWEPNKLALAVSWLQDQSGNMPALYAGRTTLIDVNNQPIGLSPMPARPLSFSNALVQNIAGGNTMVFNAAARELIARAGFAVGIAAHDWLAYLLVTSCGGPVHYDPYPAVRYRQHGRNQIGSEPHLLTRVSRLRCLLGGQFSRWIDVNLASLESVREHLTESNQIILEIFSNSRRKALHKRLMGLVNSGVRRQTLIGNIGLAFAALLKKL
ncbi:MAG: glycosyltransferase family 2 protein [Burkholderiales bacterium]